MALTGFISATANHNGGEDPNKGKSLTIANSPFLDGVVLTISDFGFRVAEIDGKVAKDARVLPVLVTSVGDLFISMLIRSKVDKDGNILETSGDLNELVKSKIAELRGKTDGEILSAIVGECKGKKFVVKRQNFAALTKDGRQYPTSLININEVK